MVRAVIFDFFGVVLVGGEPNRELLNFIRQNLKPKYKIGILSNAAGDISRLLSPNDLSLFDSIVISYQYGMAKPQKEIYEIAAEKLGALPEQCALIDDTVSHCEGAKASKMKVIFYQDFSQMRSELEKILLTSTNN